MARPLKVGLDYFPSDCDIYADFKIMELLREYGPLGYSIYDWMLRRIYKEGYYLEADFNQISNLLIRDIGSKWIKNKEVVLQVIHYCAEIGLIDDDLLRQNVITSVGIQKRYFLVTSRRKLPNVIKKMKYCILPDAVLIAFEKDINVDINDVNVRNNSVNSDNKYIKKRKVKESKVNNNIDLIKEVIEYLNLNARTNYRYTSNSTQEIIRARINEKYTIDDLKKVVDHQCAAWIGTDFEKFLRPSTLFSASKFENYLNNVPKIKGTKKLPDWYAHPEKEVVEIDENFDMGELDKALAKMKGK